MEQWVCEGVCCSWLCECTDWSGSVTSIQESFVPCFMQCASYKNKPSQKPQPMLEEWPEHMPWPLAVFSYIAYENYIILWAICVHAKLAELFPNGSIFTFFFLIQAFVCTGENALSTLPFTAYEKRTTGYTSAVRIICIWHINKCELEFPQSGD